MSHTLERMRMAYRTGTPFAEAAVRQLINVRALPDGCDFLTAQCVVEAALRDTESSELPFENILEAIATSALPKRRKRQLARLAIKLRGNSGSIPREYALLF